MTHRLGEQFLIRVPALPFATLPALAHADAAGVRAALRELVEQPGIVEAIYVAAPGLAAQLTAWRGGVADPALERTLIRYVARMAGRATPFGLFSGVAVGNFAAATRLDLASRDEHQRHTRLDNDYLSKLCDALAADPQLRPQLTFVTNSSLYRADTFWRYAESRMSHDMRSYNLLAATATPYLDAVLARAATGATLAQLGDVLDGDPELTREMIDEYIGELVIAQLIVPTLQPTVTGREPVYAIIDALGDAPAGAVLAEVTRDLEALDAARGASPDTYRAIAAKLEALPVPVDPARLFQVDLHVAMPGLAIGPRLATELRRAFELVCRFGWQRRADAWSRFREAFSTRYETREVPLVDVLDEESGIGFGDAPADTAQAPLLADVVFPGRGEGQSVVWTQRDARMLTLVDAAVSRGAIEIELTEDDVKTIGSDEVELPDAVHLQTTIIASSAEAIDRGELQLRVGPVGSASATRILGRFCHGSPPITALVRGLTAHEQAAAPDVIFAEIVHLPEGRIGNILLRPLLRDYEIPYLGTSGADRDHQLPVTDLMVSVVGDRVVLRSKRLGKEVRPQMATAHNYPVRSLVIYRFLCSHATQRTNGAGWSWGVLEDAPFLPRVRHGKVILSRARWLLSRAELAALKGSNAAAHALRERRRLPRWIVVAQSDNELVVDFDNPVSVESFTSLVKDLSSAELFELLPAADQLAVHGADGGYVHELVVPFVREAAPSEARPSPPPSTIQRRFAPGSNWLYAKLYCGTATADAFLRELAPFVRDMLAEGLADRFFFLRFGDPDHHLRLRFRGDPARLTGTLLPRLHAAIEPALARGSVWRMQLDTYEREVERYGGDAAIDLAEELFAADSEAVLAIVESTPGDEGAQARWRLTLRGVDQLMGDLGMTPAEQLALMTSMRDSYGAEHAMDTSLQRQLGDKYRLHRDELAKLLSASADSDHELAPGLVEFARRGERFAPIAAKLRELDVAIPALASSLAHMHVIRMLASMQRRQELVLYDLLRRHYDGVRARAKKPR